MGFVFERIVAKLSRESNQEYRLFTIKTKRDRKRFSKFLKLIQFKRSELKIELTCYPTIENYHKYNVCDFNQTLRSEVTDLVRRLNTDGYFVVAEVLI